MATYRVEVGYRVLVEVTNADSTIEKKSTYTCITKNKVESGQVKASVLEMLSSVPSDANSINVYTDEEYDLNAAVAKY